MRLPALLLPALLATFLAGLLPLTAEYVLFHPDERHYVDAGIRMVQTGDYLTPRTAEGALRLKKPILSYWSTAVGFRIVGVSPLGARLGFLIAGAAVVGLAWWGGLIAFESRRAACFATLAAMTQPALLISAPRSVPDVWLALGIQLGVCGGLLIVRSPGASRGGWVCVAAGGTIAILSKGLPAAAFLGYLVVFLAWRRPALLRHEWRRCAIAGAVCLIAGGSWFALMALRYPEELGVQFLGDQLGPNRFAASAWQAAVQLPMCIGALAAMSGPWLIAAAPTRRAAGWLRTFARQPTVELLLGWTMLYCLLAATINHVTPRYLLPAAAPLSILVGGLLQQCDAAQVQRRLWRVLCAMATTVGAVGIGADALLNDVPLGLLSGCAVAAGLLMAVLRARRWSAVAQGLSMTLVLHATLCGGTLRLASALRPAEIGARLRAQLAERGRPAETTRIVVAGEASHLTRIRVALGGTLPVVRDSSVGRIGPGDVLLIDESLGAAYGLSDRDVTRIACGYRRLETAELLHALLCGELRSLLEDRQRRFAIASPHRAEVGVALQSAEGARAPLSR